MLERYLKIKIQHLFKNGKYFTILGIKRCIQIKQYVFRGKAYINIGKKDRKLLLYVDDVPTRKMNKLF